MLHWRVPCVRISSNRRHLRRCVSLPPVLTNWHFLPLSFAITTSTRLRPAQPRSLELPLALMPFFREARSFLRAPPLSGASLSVHPPPLLLFPPPPPPLLLLPPVPPPPAG